MKNLPESTSLSLLRAGVLAGRSVLVRDDTHGRLLGFVREAAAVAGRLGDLRVIHLGMPSGLNRFTAHSRRPGPGTLPPDGYVPTLDAPSHDDGLDPFSDEDEDTAQEDIERAFRVGLSVLPELAPADLRDGRAILVTCGQDGLDMPDAYFDWLVAVATAGATHPATPPLTFRKATGHDMAKAWTRWPVKGQDPWLKGFSKAGDALADVLPRIREWSARCKAFHRSIVPVHDGWVAHMRAPGRLVVARAGKTGKELDAISGNYELFEIDDDGWSTGLSFSELPFDESVLDHLVRSGWTSGLTHLQQLGVEVLGIQGTALRHHSPAAMTLRSAGGVVGALVDAHEGMQTYPAVREVVEARSVLFGSHADPRRREFIRTWRALSFTILDPEVRRAVEAGEESVPAVARHVGTSVAIARRLVGRPSIPLAAHHSPILPGTETYPFAATLAAIGHDRLPPAGDTDGWNAFRKCCNLVVNLIHGADITPPPGREIGELLVRVPGRDWVERRDAILRHDEGEITFIADLVVRTEAWLGDLLDRETDTLGVLRLLVGNRSLIQLRDTSREWHGNPVLHEPWNDMSWPVPFARADLGDGWAAVALDSNAALSSEGAHAPDAEGIEGLRHCVGGYGKECQSGKSIILSLRRTVDGITHRVSTAELRRDLRGEWTFPGHAARYVLHQHRGLRNALVTPEAYGRLGTLQKRLAAGQIPIDVGALEPRESVTVSEDEVRVWARRILPSYIRLFPAPLRSLDPDAFMAEADRRLGPDTGRTTWRRHEDPFEI